MRESRTYGSVRGALSNERPYRDFWLHIAASAHDRFWHEGCVRPSYLVSSQFEVKRPCVGRSHVQIGCAHLRRAAETHPGLAPQACMRLSGTTPPLSASLVMTCLWSQIFISAEPSRLPL